MRYLAISGEDSSTYLLVCDKSCFVLVSSPDPPHHAPSENFPKWAWCGGSGDETSFVHSKSVHVLLAQARPAMINHHTSNGGGWGEPERAPH